MIEESAIVVKVDNRQVWVSNAQHGVCCGCQQKSACSTQALASILSKKPVPVDSEFMLTIGDAVIVGIDESVLLRASLLLYLAPLVALFIGAAVASWLLPVDGPYTDIWVAASGLLSLLLALLLINKVQSLLLFNYYARPVVIRKI
ncbi:MAG: SoxR reducing system RseC family protein [Methylovulum sp.]|nr:SoxR reducing system RseC family protein [Methylovulum sp.]